MIAQPRASISDRFSLLLCIPLVFVLAVSESHAQSDSDDAWRKGLEREDSESAPLEETTSGVGREVVEIEKEAPLDQLPWDSREHLRQELRKLIIGVGQWDPSIDGKQFEFTPSSAAEGDPALRAEEEAAWEAMVEEYHARERAAYGAADHGARAGTQPAGETGSSAAGAGDPGPGQQVSGSDYIKGEGPIKGEGQAGSGEAPGSAGPSGSKTAQGQSPAGTSGGQPAAAESAPSTTGATFAVLSAAMEKPTTATATTRTTPKKTIRFIDSLLWNQPWELDGAFPRGVAVN
jgi:hypothetical protein